MSIFKNVLVGFLCIYPFCGRAAPVKVPSEHLCLLNLGVRVQDTEGNPIEGADIIVHFQTIHPDHGGFYIHKPGKSVAGESVRFKERALETQTVVMKEGYWRSDLVDKWLEAINKETGWYIPESKKDILIVLRKQHNPRPLYAHRADNLFLREFGVPYGYDLSVGDFVRPHGKGTRADMVFTMRGEVNNETGEYDVVTTLSFPNKGDGVLPVKRMMTEVSELLLGQEAPEKGYEPTYEMHNKNPRRLHLNEKPISAPQSLPKLEEDQNFEGLWFRTHTELDPETGAVIRARYGKIHSSRKRPIIYNFAPETPQWQMGLNLKFIYFYAPDHSRSVEFNGNTLVPDGNLQGVDKR